MSFTGEKDVGEQLGGRYWPTEAKRPHESVPEWCRRLDAYTNRTEAK